MQRHWKIVLVACLIAPVGTSAAARESRKQTPSASAAAPDDKFLPVGYAPAEETASCSEGSCSEVEAPCVALCRSGWIGGAAIYFLKPNFEDNQAFTTTTGLTTANRSRVTTEFDWNYSTSPLGWLGYQFQNGWGVRARFFYFDQGSNSPLTSLAPAGAATSEIRPPAHMPDLDLVAFRGSPGSPGVLLKQGLGVDQLLYNSSLRINAYDLEAIYDIRGCTYSLLFSGGVRYLYMAQRYDQFLFNTVTVGYNTATETSQLDFFHDFNGLGPTVAFQVHRTLGATRLALFGDVRGSLLVGTARRTLTFQEVVDDPGAIDGGSQARSAVAFGSQTGVLSVIELEVGLEYARRIGCSDLFARGALVDQTYFGAGNASRQDGNLSLFGVQVSVGVNY